MRQFGARSFDFDLDTGEATLLPPAGVAVDLSKLRRAVHDSGFELLALRLEVAGTLHSQPGSATQGGPVLQSAAGDQQFRLVEGSTEVARAAWSRLLRGPDPGPDPKPGPGQGHRTTPAGARVVVRGGLPAEPGTIPTLEVTDVEFPED